MRRTHPVEWVDLLYIFCWFSCYLKYYESLQITCSCSLKMLWNYLHQEKFTCSQYWSLLSTRQKPWRADQWGYFSVFGEHCMPWNPSWRNTVTKLWHYQLLGATEISLWTTACCLLVSWLGNRINTLHISFPNNEYCFNSTVDHNVIWWGLPFVSISYFLCMYLVSWSWLPRKSGCVEWAWFEWVYGYGYYDELSVALQSIALLK